jgi:hypothetical protein
MFYLNWINKYIVVSDGLFQIFIEYSTAQRNKLYQIKYRKLNFAFTFTLKRIK